VKLVETSVRRPVGVFMIVLSIVALGFVSLRNLTIDLYPDIDLPIAVVSTSYEGAAPEEVEKLVSRPIEGAVSTIEGIETVQSRSQAGASLVVLLFNTDSDIDSVLLEVRERVDQVRGMLPDAAGEPNVLRFDPQQIPVLWVGLTGENEAELQRIAENQIIPHLEKQEGVGSVSITGGIVHEVQVELIPEKLALYHLNTQQITQAIAMSNQSASAGMIEKGDQNLQIRIEGEYESLEDIKETLIQTPAGAILHLEDIANIDIVEKERTSLSFVNGTPSVVLSILKKTEGNTVEVADVIYEAIDELTPNLPEGVELDIVFDTSIFVRMAIDSVVGNILLGSLISAAVLLLFLKSVRATLVIGISIPIAIISTFTLMYFTGETINVLTMGGLALGVGMIVDCSIVILEHIVTYRQQRYSLKEAAKLGASELAPAVIASTTTTVVVFLPIVFVEGIAAELFKPLAMTITFSLLASLVVSVTLVPMLASKLLTRTGMKEGRRYWFDQLLHKLNTFYKGILRGVLKYRKTTVFSTLAAIGLSFALIPFIGTEFIPASDQGQIEIDVQTKSGTNLISTTEITEQINEKLQPYQHLIETNFITVGGGTFEFTSSTNEASFMIQLIPASERKETTKDMVAKWQEELASIPGAEMEVRDMSTEMGMGSPVQIQINGPDYAVLKELAEQVAFLINDIDGVHNPETSAEEGQPEVNVLVNRELAAQYGLSYQEVMSQVQFAFSGQIASRYREEGNEYDVRVVLPKDERSKIEDLEMLPIETPTGALIPLKTIAELEQIQGPASLTRENQQRQINVTSDIVGRDLGNVIKDIEAKLNTLKWPEGYTYSIGGQAEDMMDSFRKLNIALIFSIFLVYAVMAVQFENFLHPFVIMFSLPATVIGILFGLYVTDIPLSIPAFIGVIMLAGIVVNNAIVLVDYINILRRKGMSRYEAILKAGPSRMRPILMTTLTTVLGMIPLALGLGEGSEAQQPLAIVIIFGLSISTIFTLLLIPVVYTYLDDLSGKVGRMFGGRKE
jgi:CzcA family heavy metal efflux pump